MAYSPIEAPSTEPSPLRKLFGFEVAEEVYDTMDIRQQTMLDLKIAGWSQEDIGELYGITQGWVSILFADIRHEMANSKLLARHVDSEKMKLLAGEGLNVVDPRQNPPGMSGATS